MSTVEYPGRPAGDRPISVQLAARILGGDKPVHESTVRRYLQEGRVAGYRIGREIRIWEQSVLNFVTSVQVQEDC